MIEPKVYIIIINFNGLKDTTECIESLKKITYTNYRLVLVDNASNNNESKILKEKFGEYVNVINNNENLGFAQGNNVGMEYALSNGADFVLLLNNDTVVKNDFLTEVVETAKQDANIGIVSAKSLVFGTNKVWFDGGRIDWRNNKIVHFNYYGNNDLNDIDLREIDFANGCCVLIRREALEKSGFFDKRFFYYFEDVELSARIRKNGFRIMHNPQALIWHKKDRIIKGEPSSNEIYYGLRNTLLFFSENNSFRNKIGLFTKLFLSTIPGALFSIREQKIQSRNFRHNTLSAVNDFIFKKFGNRYLK